MGHKNHFTSSETWNASLKAKWNYAYFNHNIFINIPQCIILLEVLKERTWYVCGIGLIILYLSKARLNNFCLEIY